MATTSYDNHSLDFSDRFVLSSGTVSIDCDRDLVLLLYYRPKGEYLLPKGRKNVGESLQDAAERETFEESGYTCRLVGHNLPTETPQPPTMAHTELIAVQQRTSHGIRKIIFWYVAHVDSSDRPIAQTQEEGEDFEVRWVCRKDAPSTMSFEEDRMIVGKALSAVPFRVVEKKEDIIRLINEHKSELCTLLRTEKEECPLMKFPKDSPLPVEWDVLRFSGWTRQGSKRTIKIWTKTSHYQVASKSTPSHLGVLSYKVVRWTRRDHPIRGPRLFVFQPSEEIEQLHILHNSDFINGPAPDAISPSNGRPYEAVSPGVTYDLFLTSLCIFGCKSGLVASFKAAILQKWQLLAGADGVKSIMPLFYRGASFGHSYSKMLRAEINEVESNCSEDTMRTKIYIQKTHKGSTLTPSDAHQPYQFSGKDASEYSTGYQGLYFTPLQRRAAPLEPLTDSILHLEQSFPAVFDIRDEDTAITLTRFSSNSKGSNADTPTSANLEWQPIYINDTRSVPDELAALPSVRYHFPKEIVQVLAAAQPALRRLFSGGSLVRRSTRSAFDIAMAKELLEKTSAEGTAFQTNGLLTLTYDELATF